MNWNHYLRSDLPNCESDALRTPSVRAVRKIAVLLLLVFLAGFSTTLKYGQYFPQGDPIGHAAMSNKMDVAHAPATCDSAPVETATELVPPEPRCETFRREPPPPLVIQLLGLTLSLQHRSPPSLFLS
jgi:hypothetical protein